jgi:hypothetical protein
MPLPSHSAPRDRKRQGGFAMLAIISLIVMLSAYLLVKQLNASVGFAAEKRDRNAQVLNQAKQALTGYVAQRALLAGEDNPGRLPCPEAGAYYGDPAQEGIAAPFCTLPAVGRLPWRTLGMDKLVDAASEPLWYVVSPGWALPSSGATLTINSNTAGQLTVDGVANDAVALIVAPGAAFDVPAAAGCAARSQTHPTAAGTLDLRNYLECENATSPADANFVTTGPSTSLNDQVLRVTAADLLPGIEAAIAERIKREIVPALRNVYADPLWGSGIISTNPLFPYPASFSDPSTSNFQGASGVSQGLLPFNQTQGCDPLADPRCTTTLTAWASGTPPDVTKIGGWGLFQTKNCSWQSGGNVALCEGEYHEDFAEPWRPGMIIQMTATIRNVAMGLRAFDATKATIEAENDAVGGAPLQTVPVNITRTMNSTGSVTITFSGRLPNIDDMGWGDYAVYRIRLDRSVIGDHALLDPANATTGWFVRNQWYRVVYYAPAAGYTATALPGTSCTNGVSCLSVANLTPTNNQRAILILMGRRLTGPPNSSNPADYLEFGNANLPLDTAFEQRTVSRAVGAPFNDRVVVLDAN